MSEASGVRHQPSGARGSVALGDVVPNAVDRLTAAALAHAGIANPDEARAVIDAGLVLAQDWFAGRISLDEVRRQSTPQERFLLARFVRPMPAHVAALFDALVDSDVTSPDGLLYRTKHGLIPRQEMPGALTKIEHLSDGRLRFRFASFWPWQRKPNDNGRDEDERAGTRGEAVFAEDATERNRYAAMESYRRQSRNDPDPWDG